MSVCTHRDETDLSSITFLLDCNGFCLLLLVFYNDTGPIRAVLTGLTHTDVSLCPSYVWNSRSFFGPADHNIVNVKTHEPLEFATDMAGQQTWFMSTTAPTQLLRIPDK